MHVRRKMHLCQFWAYFVWLSVLKLQRKIENSKYYAKINTHTHIAHKYKLQDTKENKIWIDYLQP